MMLCDVCYEQVFVEHLVDQRNFVSDHEALFDTICMGRNRLFVNWVVSLLIVYQIFT